MNDPGPLSISARLLHGPGPSDVHPRVLRAMASPVVGHMDPQFLQVMGRTQAMLRAAFLTRNHLTLPVSGTGMAGLETCLVNLLEPGDPALVCVAGFFGQRMAEVAARAGARVTTIERPWGEVFDPQQVRDALRRVRPKLVAIVHAETSTGAWQPVEELGAICRKSDALLVLDAVTSLGCVPLRLDDWGVDAAYSCSQKGLSCPPGLAPVSFGERAVEAMRRRKCKVQSWYLDMTLIQRY
jgi:alanine-glyoxylate transaminase/serine-glyoxylate transaminase/serine-pyruvate transaminase